MSALERGSRTIEARLASTSHPTGFDYLRIVLAMSVILIHSKTFTLGPVAQTLSATVDPSSPLLSPVALRPPIYQPVIWAVLPCFFALSGFLVSGSLHRSRTTTGFLLLRALRIFPALCVESLLAMLVLGPLVTNLSLRSYFSDPLFREYPLNVIGVIRYYLPGVFLDNPVPRVVNAQLWTIPAEMRCYAFLAAVLVLQLAHRRLTVPLITVATFAYLLSIMATGVYRPADWGAGAGSVQIETLVLSFMVGVTFFELKDRIPLRSELFGLSVALAYVLLWGGSLQYLATIPIAYLTIFVGLTNLPTTFITRTGDYSYGVYLYGLPLQQFVVYLFPENKNWLLSFAIALALSLVFAAFSWHVVESKVMARKKMIVDAAESLLKPLWFRFPWGPQPLQALASPAMPVNRNVSLVDEGERDQGGRTVQ